MRFGLPLLLLACAEEEVPPDVVLITWDTVRADHVAGNPTWDRLTTEGITFTQARSPVPITLPAHSTIMTGRYPPAHGARDNARFSLDEELPVLAEAFAAAGYQTAGFVSAPVLEAGTGIARGFTVFDDDVSLPYRPAGPTIDAALSWLAGRDPAAPVFLWVHLFDAHHPWKPSREDWEAANQNAYAAEIAAVDAQTGRLIDALSPHSVVALTADHGEGLGEHEELTHAWFAYDSTLAIPMLLWWGEGLDIGTRGTTISAPASLADLSPTLRRLADLPAVETEGADLFSLPAQRAMPIETVAPVYIMGAAPVFGTITEEGTVWIDLPIPERYELSTDPAQSDNRYRPEDAAALQQALDRWPRRWPQEASALDAATLENLAALGYISGAGSSDDDDAPDPKTRIDLFNLLSSPRTEHPPEEALRRGEAMRQKYGLSSELALYLADCLSALGRISEALTVLEEAARYAPDEVRLQQAVQQRQQQRAQTQQQLAAIQAALAATPDHPSAHYDLGVSLQYLEQLDAAAAAFRVALEQDPEDVQARRMLAMVLRNQGRPEEAIAVLQPAAGSMPIPCDLGRILALYMDQRQAARPHLEACWAGGGLMTTPDHDVLRDTTP